MTPTSVGWKPNNPPSSVDFPYNGSHLVATINTSIEITSVLIESSNSTQETIKVAFAVHVGSELWPEYLVNPTDGSFIFDGDSGTKIPLPAETFVRTILVYLVSPDPSSSFNVKFYGCALEGEDMILINLHGLCNSQI